MTIAGTAHFGTLRASFDAPPIRSSDGEKREPAVFLAGRSDGGASSRCGRRLFTAAAVNRSDERVLSLTHSFSSPVRLQHAEVSDPSVDMSMTRP